MSKEREELKEIVWEIAIAACQRIDDPKNVAKGEGWTLLDDDELRSMQGEEELEATEVVQKQHPWWGESYQFALDEFGDGLVGGAMRLYVWRSAQ